MDDAPAIPTPTDPSAPEAARSASGRGVPAAMPALAVLLVAALCVAGAGGGVPGLEGRPGDARHPLRSPGRLVESASLHLIAAVTLAGRHEVAPSVRPILPAAAHVEKVGPDRREPVRSLRIDVRHLDLPPPARA